MGAVTKRKAKTDLKADEIKFIHLVAETDDVRNSAKTAFPDVRFSEKKGFRILELPFAQELLQQRREHLARQLEDKFKFQSTNLLQKLLRQADGQEVTKKVVKTKEGEEIETQEHYDSLGAATRVMEIAGRIGQKIEVNNDNREIKIVREVID